MRPKTVNGGSLPRLVRRYRVEWQHKHPIWGIVEATTKSEAIQKARRGEFIGEVDSDPGKDDWRNPDVKEQAPNDQRSRAGPTALSSQQDKLPALAAAPR